MLDVLTVSTGVSIQKFYKKIIYPGNRSFLEPNDPLRDDCVSSPSKTCDISEPPARARTCVCLGKGAKHPGGPAKSHVQDDPRKQAGFAFD